MTINLNDLIEDREAGTDGPWWSDCEYSEDEYGVAVIAARTDCGPLPGNPTRGMVAWASELLPENGNRCESDARRIARLPDLEAAYIEAVELLRRFVDVNDEPCWRDHHGYCQAHFLEEECMVADARKFLGDK